MTTEHEERSLEELLPWYANGTLEAEERERVEAWLAESSRARDELAFLQSLRDGVKQSGRSEPLGELEVRRFMRRLDREERSARPVSRPLIAALAASIAVIAIQAALLIRAPGDGYTPLGAPAADLQIRFAPDASESQIREVLRAAEAQIADGPGAAGVYRLRVLGDPDDDARIARALELLRERADVVVHVARE